MGTRRNDRYGLLKIYGWAINLQSMGVNKGWVGFFRDIDRELREVSKVFWTMTKRGEHRVQWKLSGGKWGLTKTIPPKGCERVSFFSCVHRVRERTRFWKKLYERMGDGGRVLILTQGCQSVCPVPPRLAAAVPDAPSVESLLKEMRASGFVSCCAKVHLVRRNVKRETWIDWLGQGCFSDADYCDRVELRGFGHTLGEEVEVVMAYYILVGIKLGAQSGYLDVRPSQVHGLSGCARTMIKKDAVILSVPTSESGGRMGTMGREWHKRGRRIGLHLCSTVYRLFNHSDAPNCRITKGGLIKTSKKLEAGEELTLNYSIDPAVD